MGYEPSRLIAQLNQIDLRSVGDQTMQVNAEKYVVKRIIVANINGTVTGAQGGFYTAPNKGGTALVAAGQVYTSVIPNRTADLTLTANTNVTIRTEGFLYMSLTVASSTPATADVFVLADVLTDN